MAYVDSRLPGVLDLTENPLDDYLRSECYGSVVRGFFDLASDVISNDNPRAMREFDVIVPFVRDLLRTNHSALVAAPDSNLIRRHFKHWDLPLTPEAIADLDEARVKELGTTIVATFDTTALSLLWALVLLEGTEVGEVREQVVDQARGNTGCPHQDGGLSAIDLAVLEAVRLGGSNPSALWRRTTQPVNLRHDGHTVTVPTGTMMWLDRRQANRDPDIFPRPCSFAPATELLPTPVRANVHGVASTRRTPGLFDRFSYVTFLDSGLDGVIHRLENGTARPLQSVADFAVQEVGRTYDDSGSL